MNTSFWGPHAWRFLHAITFDYPEKPTSQQKQYYGQFFNTLQYVLPCAKCRSHFAKMLEAHPIEPHLNSKKELSEYLVECHNKVNERLGKPSMTYEEVKELYENQQTQCTIDTPCVTAKQIMSQRHVKIQTLLMIFILILLSLILYHTYAHKK
jgi:hypothetical protein